MRFLLDEQLPLALVGRLAAAGHEADHVLRLGLGGASDRQIWSACSARTAVLMTKDEDFLELARYPGAACQLVWVRVGNATTAALWRRLEPVLPDLVAALDAGERIVELH